MIGPSTAPPLLPRMPFVARPRPIVAAPDAVRGQVRYTPSRRSAWAM